ncbi:hypothetical protein FGIG_11043 [Fasciola gigantica]|uniref:Uncharacterized protein n=1 Tax=Fasciola gigantica TaxID=46835 RepID=A0A504Z597_FASGI|nr:hypothetical protein FGIG_11043 [Fasciola gigantica]
MIHLNFVIIFTMVTWMGWATCECLIECKAGKKPEWKKMPVHPYVGTEPHSCHAIDIEKCK